MHPGCLDAYCSDSCRTAHHRTHSLLCTGGLAVGSPLKEFGALTARQPTDALLLAALLVAKAVGEGLDLDWLEQWTDDAPGSATAPPAWLA